MKAYPKLLRDGARLGKRGADQRTLAKDSDDGSFLGRNTGQAKARDKVQWHRTIAAFCPNWDKVSLYSTGAASTAQKNALIVGGS